MINKKELKLKDHCLKKQSREHFSEDNVIYIIPTEIKKQSFLIKDGQKSFAFCPLKIIKKIEFIL